jgi:acetylornithine aminotransferase
MAIEIERKFLVKEKPFHLARKSLIIRQGYIVNDQKQVIRVREKGNDYFLTVKGNNIGISRLEFDFPIAAIRTQLLNNYHIFTGASANPNLLRILPPLGITKQQVKPFIAALKEILS